VDASSASAHGLDLSRKDEGSCRSTPCSECNQARRSCRRRKDLQNELLLILNLIDCGFMILWLSILSFEKWEENESLVKF
jgi:hypothetical protein